MDSNLQQLMRYWKSDQSNISLIKEILKTILLVDNDENQAVEFFDHVKSINPEITGVDWIYAEVLTLTGRFEKAKDLYEILSSDNIERASHGIALCCYFESDFQSAKDCLFPFCVELLNAPLDVAMLYIKCVYHLGDIEEAHRDSLKIIKSKVELDSEFLGLIAMISFDNGAVNEAGVLAKQSLAKNGDMHDGLIAAASYNLHHLNFDLAEPHAVKAVDLYRHSGRAWLVKAQVEMLGNKMIEAYRSVGIAVEAMPNHIGTWHLKGWLELIANDFALAGHSFEMALSLNRNFSETHGALAVLDMCKGLKDDARKKAKIGLRLDPSCTSAMYVLEVLDDKGEGSNNPLYRLINRESHLSGVSYLTLAGAVEEKQSENR